MANNYNQANTMSHTDSRQRIRVAIDVGGTFTDIQIYDAGKGRILPHKVPTTPHDPSIGLVEGLKQASTRYGFELRDIDYVLHGTTIATNAVLERKLARGAIITTAGFEDVLEIGRHSRRDVYSLKPRQISPLIPRSRRIGVNERILGTGLPEEELSNATLDNIVRKLKSLEVEAVAISLLNSYLNPVHEKKIEERLARQLPDIPVSLSSTISPEIREYERTSTTVLNALLIPIVKRYLDRLEERLRSAGITARLFIVQSNGGVCSVSVASSQPVRLLLSGPSGGALGTLAMSRLLKIPSLIAGDMGGTSFDVSIIRDDRMEVVTEGEIGGGPVRIPMVEIRTIGSGGGSIGRVDSSGNAMVGPESAGARPGPVCYRAGGTEPTVTDANLVLGHLDAHSFFGGAMPLDLQAAKDAITTQFAAPLGIDAETAAEGIINIANASLANAIKLSLFEKGLDPRDFGFLSFGGAGSIHACAVAQELGVKRVVFPKNASTFSAWGILFSNITHDFARSRLLDLQESSAKAIVRNLFEDMTTQAREQLREDGIDQADQYLEWSLDLRYKGQAFELTVPGGELNLESLDTNELVQRFHDIHFQRFSYSNPGDPVELVTARLTASGKLGKINADEPTTTSVNGEPKRRSIWKNNRWHEVDVIQRSALGSSQSIKGPAIIEEEYTTIMIGEGWTASCDSMGLIHATFNGELE